MLRVSDGIRDGVRLAVPQPTEWQRIGNQIDAAMIFCGGGFRKHLASHCDRSYQFAIAAWEAKRQNRFIL